MPEAVKEPEIVRVPYSNDKFYELQQAQNMVNYEVEYLTDIRQFGLDEFWAIAGNRGDCEDYVLAKMKLLRKMGWPLGSLDMGVCYNQPRSGHAVLIAHTTKGDYVLDNIEDRVKPWTEFPYEWVSMSIGGSFLHWREIKG